MQTSACDFISSKDESACSSAQTATCITCGNVPNVWGFQSWSSSAASPGFDRKAGLSHKMKWSVQLCAPASTGGSPHSALLGVRYTLERHAGIIRDPRLLKKLRNSHELHCGRWINRPWLELWGDFFFFFFYRKKGFSVCLEPPFNCLNELLLIWSNVVGFSNANTTPYRWQK